MRRPTQLLVLLTGIAVVHLGSQTPRTFRVWVFADAHVGTDLENGRESLALALRQSEAATGLAWDIALDLGDLSGAQGTPKDSEGIEIGSSRTLMRPSVHFRLMGRGSGIPSGPVISCS
jgi:hypothetical protein